MRALRESRSTRHQGNGFVSGCNLTAMKALRWVVTAAILLLGAVHTGMGFYCMEFNQNALWFIGSGVAIVFAGLFNALLVISPSRAVRAFAIAVNATVLGLFVLAMQVISGAHVYAALALFLLATVLAVIKPTEKRSSASGYVSN